MDIYEEITKLLYKESIGFQSLSHEPVYTSAEASKIRPDISLHQGAKAIVLKVKMAKGATDEKFIMAVVPGDMRINTKVLKKELKCYDLVFAKPEEVVSISGVEPGAVPPFGNLVNLQVYMATSFSDVEKIAFNPGRHDRTIIMDKTDYIRLVKPIQGDYAKD